MGMFDYVKCDYQLPITGFENRLFQTKDINEHMNRNMDTYRILKTGQLIEDDQDANPMNFTGTVYFYDFVAGSKYQGNKGWIEFSAEFCNGHLQGEIKLEEYDCPDD